MVQERTLPVFDAQSVNLSRDEGLMLYEDMVLGRYFEDKCAEMYYRGKMFGFVHLYNGQEAVSTGGIRSMRRDDTDYVSSTYRAHVHAFSAGVRARGGPAELFGRGTGSSGGRRVREQHLPRSRSRLERGRAGAGSNGGVVREGNRLLEGPRRFDAYVFCPTPTVGGVCF